jgi:glycerophosphoryl diester phosphodiesterase
MVLFAAIVVSAPIVIAHRGASAYRPEHTLASYELAIDQGADFIEPDLVSTKDGELVARHENEISGTTDVATHPEFADRRTTKVIDGQTETGWFTEDFTLKELRTLRAKERLPQLRTANVAYDGKFQVPTFEEILDLLRRRNRGRKKPVGVYPETKHPTYFRSIGLALEPRVVEILHRRGYEKHPEQVFLQCFEVAGCRALSKLTRLPVIQLIDASGQPYDWTLAGDKRTIQDLISPSGLAEVATYAQGIGVAKELVIPRVNGELGSPTSLVENAQRAGLKVHLWTFRPEPFFLPKSLNGKPEEEIRAFVRAGINGFFTDAPDTGRRAVSE